MSNRTRSKVALLTNSKSVVGHQHDDSFHHSSSLKSNFYKPSDKSPQTSLDSSTLDHEFGYLYPQSIKNLQISFIQYGITNLSNRIFCNVGYISMV